MISAAHLVRPLRRAVLRRCLAVEQHITPIPTAGVSATRSFSYVSSPTGLPQNHQPRWCVVRCSPTPSSLTLFKRQFHITGAVLAGLPMSKEFVEERVMLVLKLYDKVDHAKLNLDADFQKDLGLDSLDHVEIVFAMEEEFYFEIPDVDAERMHTPRDIAQYVCDKEDIHH